MTAKARAFLTGVGIVDAAFAPLGGHASSKRYWRITSDGKSYILLSCDPHVLTRIQKVYRLLRENDIPVATIHEHDLQGGFALLEDLGDRLLSTQFEGGRISEEYVDLFKLAVEILVHIQRIPCAESGVPQLRAHDYALQLDTLTDWYIPDVTGEHLGARAVLAFFEAIGTVEPFAALLPRTLVHCDFYSGNLMLVPSQPGGVAESQLFVLDYDDAALWSPAYDLVSLLQDLRCDVDRRFEQMLKARYLELTKFPRDEFETEYAVVGALRAMRVLGLWHRLKRRDGKPEYMQYERFTRQKVDLNLGHPALVEVRRLYRTVIG
jgi:hypothetical protein